MNDRDSDYGFYMPPTVRGITGSGGQTLGCLPIVNLSDLHQPGDSLQQAVNRLTSPVILRLDMNFNDTLAAAGDDLRDRALIESLIVNDDSPNPWEMC